MFSYKISSIINRLQIYENNGFQKKYIAIILLNN